MNKITERDLKDGADLLQKTHPMIAERIRRHIGNIKAWKRRKAQLYFKLVEENVHLRSEVVKLKIEQGK